MKTAKEKDLKPGDVVVITGRYGDDRLAKVERLTATQVIATGGIRFNRRTGRQIGSHWGWHTPYIKLATQSDREEIERKRLVYHLTSLTSNALTGVPLDTLREAWKLLSEKEEPS